MTEPLENFPWCSIPKASFERLHLSTEDINTTQAQAIVRRDWNENMPYLIHGGYLRFDQQFLMGLYYRERPLGFAVGGKYNLENQTCGEVGMVYTGIAYRGKGVGTTLMNLATSRILTMDPQAFYTYERDETGIIRFLLREQGYTLAGKNDQSSYPQWVKEVSHPAKKQEFIDKLSEGIGRGLRRIEEHLPYFELLAS